MLLNFPLTTLAERLEGAGGRAASGRRPAWPGRFSTRIPADVKAWRDAGAEADHYIAEYNIWMHHVVDGQAASGSSPPRLRLLSALEPARRDSRPTTPTRRRASPSSG